MEAELREAGATLERLRGIRLLEDDSVLSLYEVTADRASVETALDRTETVEHASVTAAGDTVTALVHAETPTLLREVLEFKQTQRVFFEYPFEFVEPARSSLRVTEVGPQQALERLVAIDPEGVSLDIERVQQYSPFRDHLFASLTDRQQEVLVTAYEQGYFGSPRAATHEDIAAELGCSAPTVGHHLQAIQARLVEAILPNRVEAGSRPPADD